MRMSYQIPSNRFRSMKWSKKVYLVMYTLLCLLWKQCNKGDASEKERGILHKKQEKVYQDNIFKGTRKYCYIKVALRKELSKKYEWQPIGYGEKMMRERSMQSQIMIHDGTNRDSKPIENYNIESKIKLGFIKGNQVGIVYCHSGVKCK